MAGITENRIRIAILDNHALVRAGLKLIIENQPGLEVVGETGSSMEGLELVSCQKPDIILLELNLIGDPTLDFIPKLIEAAGQGRVILVTSISDPQVYLQAIQAGIMGVVFKSQPPDMLLRAIEKVHAGEAWLERSMIANLLVRISRNKNPNGFDKEAEGIAQLSDREKQIIQLIGKGLKNKQIAAQLCISETTVRHHLTSIFSKLGVSDRLELLVFAHRSGLAKIPG